MKIERKEKYILITPDEGKVLTNGDTKSTSVYMPLDGDVSVWSEVSEDDKDYTTDEEDAALLKYVNDETDSSYDRLGDAVYDLVNNK